MKNLSDQARSLHISMAHAYLQHQQARERRHQGEDVRTQAIRAMLEGRFNLSGPRPAPTGHRMAGALKGWAEANTRFEARHGAKGVRFAARVRPGRRKLTLHERVDKLAARAAASAERRRIRSIPISQLFGDVHQDAADRECMRDASRRGQLWWMRERLRRLGLNERPWPAPTHSPSTF